MTTRQESRNWIEQAKIGTNMIQEGKHEQDFDY